MIKTIIVEDDAMHARSLADTLETHFKSIRLLAICYDIQEAMIQISALEPQLVFLDVELGAYSGFDLLAMLKKRDFEVIFTTAYQKYALQAIKMSALDYIEKPVDIKQLRSAISRYHVKTSEKKIQNLLVNFNADGNEQKVALQERGSFHFVRLSDILRLQSDSAYTIVYYKDSTLIHKMLLSKNLAYFEDMFEGKGIFYRVHNQHLVNIHYIKSMVQGKSCFIIMDDGNKSIVPVARARRDDFLHYLRNNGILI